MVLEGWWRPIAVIRRTPPIWDPELTLCHPRHRRVFAIKRDVESGIHDSERYVNLLLSRLKKSGIR